MFRSRTSLCVFVAGFFHQESAANKVTPVQKVLQMLTEMKVKSEKAMAEEAMTFKVYKEWVDDRTTTFGFDIKTAEREITALVANIDKMTSDVGGLTTEITTLQTEISNLEKDRTAATSVRKEENENFLQEQKDYQETVTALEMAIQTLKANAYDRPQAMLFLQSMAKTNMGIRRAMVQFQHKNDGGDGLLGAPSADAYKAQSGGILQILEELLGKFKSQLDTLQNEEGEKQHNNKLVMLHLTDVMTKGTSDMNEHTSTRAQTMAENSKTKADLGMTRKDLARDKEVLSEVQATFAVKSAAFAENQKVRKDELEAISKAIEILSVPVIGTATTAVGKTSLLQPGTPTFLQMGRSKLRSTDTQRAAHYLQKRAQELNSAKLSSIVSQMTAASPFEKVITMIEGLLARLEEEAAGESDHKAWCDKELKANKLKRNKRAAKVEKLEADIEVKGGNIDSMLAQIDQLSTGQVELTKAMGEATEQRQKEKTENQATIADAQAASTATKNALTVLREFFEAHASASLIQKRTGQVPEMQAYRGQQGGSKGIVGILEVMDADFERLEADTKAAESQAANEYNSFMAKAKKDKKAKHAEEVQLKLEEDEEKFQKGEVKKDLQGVQEELDGANAYFDSLKSNCLVVHVSYEERVAKREKEIEALKEAYDILDSKNK